MFFKKKKENLTSLIQQVKESENKNFDQMFQAYYRLAKAYTNKEDYERAMLYFQRADSLALAIEDFNVSEEEIDNCSQSIYELEQHNLLYHQTLTLIENKTENINYVQMTLWNLLTLCRLENVFLSFGQHKDCQVLLNISRIIDLIFQILTEGISQEDNDFINNFLDEIYDFGDSEVFYQPQTTSTIVQPSLQLFDLASGDTISSLQIFIDHEINIAHDTETSDEFATDLVASALGLLIGYYLRTQDDDITTLYQVQKELQRIQDDYDMIVNEPDIDDIIERMNTYRHMNIFA